MGGERAERRLPERRYERDERKQLRAAAEPLRPPGGDGERQRHEHRETGDDAVEELDIGVIAACAVRLHARGEVDGHGRAAEPRTGEADGRAARHDEDEYGDGDPRYAPESHRRQHEAESALRDANGRRRRSPPPPSRPARGRGHGGGTPPRARAPSPPAG